MERYRTVCTRVIVCPPVYVPVSVRAEVFSKAQEDQARREAQTCLERMFREREIGAPVLQSDLLAALGAAETVLGVKRAAMSYSGAQCRQNEQGDLLIPLHAIPYLSKMELHVTLR